jgi:SAM-dependent methyltransferase
MNADFSSTGMLGGHSPLDGTVEFYGRINAFLRPHFVVADLGAGRGAWYSDDNSAYQRSLRELKGKVSKVIGLDIDEAVRSNPSTDENVVIRGDTLPLPDESVDVVVADFVLEHLAEPAAIEREVFRILRPGGLFCARTPHALHYISIGARLLRNLRGPKVLRLAQPSRKEIDVFETRYRCNTLRRINSIWDSKRWASYSYLYTAEPSYHFGSRSLYRALRFLHKFLPVPLVGNIFVFQVKRQVTACTS